jgi:hypothetical protein
VAATASALAVAPPAGVVVTQTGGSVIDGSGVYSDWGLAQAHWAHGLEAYSLTDKGDVANAEWGIADYATQGSLIGEKLVSQGGASQRALVRSWLLKLQRDGKAWGTEEGPYHMGGQGALEGNAEAILLARAHAAHSGEAAVFTSVPERLVCYVPAGSTTPVLANLAAQAGLDSTACGVNPAPFQVPQRPQGGTFHPTYRGFDEYLAVPFSLDMGCVDVLHGPQLTRPQQPPRSGGKAVSSPRHDAPHDEATATRGKFTNSTSTFTICYATSEPT